MTFDPFYKNEPFNSAHLIHFFCDYIPHIIENDYVALSFHSWYDIDEDVIIMKISAYQDMDHQGDFIFHSMTGIMRHVRIEGMWLIL